MLQGAAMEDGGDDLVSGVPTPNRNSFPEDPPPFDEMALMIDGLVVDALLSDKHQGPDFHLEVSPSFKLVSQQNVPPINGLLALLWVYTRCKPCVKFVDLRALAHNQRNKTIVYFNVSVRISYLRTSKLSVSQVFDDSGSSTRP